MHPEMFQFALPFFLAVTDNEQIQRYFARFDETFFVYCDKELLKINTFFSGKLLIVNIVACLASRVSWKITCSEKIVLANHLIH